MGDERSSEELVSLYSLVGQRAREGQLEAETAITATVETVDNDRSFDLLLDVGTGL